jgi:hypothetical protein
MRVPPPSERHNNIYDMKTKEENGVCWDIQGIFQIIKPQRTLSAKRRSGDSHFVCLGSWDMDKARRNIVLFMTFCLVCFRFQGELFDPLNSVTTADGNEVTDVRRSYLKGGRGVFFILRLESQDHS